MRRSHGHRAALEAIVALDLEFPEACCDDRQARDAIVAAWSIARRALNLPVDPDDEWVPLEVDNEAPSP